MPDSLRAHGLPHPSSSVQGIVQARVLEWVAISFSRGSSQPRDQTQVSCSGRWILYHCATWKVSSADVAAAAAKSLQSCPTLCDPMDYRLPGFSVHGILQARTCYSKQKEGYWSNDLFDFASSSPSSPSPSLPPPPPLFLLLVF